MSTTRARTAAHGSSRNTTAQKYRIQLLQQPLNHARSAFCNQDTSNSSTMGHSYGASHIPTPCSVNISTHLVAHGCGTTCPWTTTLLTGLRKLSRMGPYHRDKAPLISGAGWILSCFRTKRQITGSFYEKSNAANSYRGELLGLHALHVLLHAIESNYELGKCPVPIWCDNKGVLSASK